MGKRQSCKPNAHVRTDLSFKYFICLSIHIFTFLVIYLFNVWIKWFANPCAFLGNFSTITVTFSFERRIGYFLIQIYFPDIFVVMLSWIVFWMEKVDIGNRMALGITTILTTMFLLGSLNGNLPKVSYPKALDWYLLVSFIFVFLSLIECTIVFLLASEAKQDKQKPIKVMVNGLMLARKITWLLKTALTLTQLTW